MTKCFKSILLATSITCCASAAFAADVAKPAAVAKPVAAVVVAPTWTGFYLGLQLGYGWGNIRYNFTSAPSHDIHLNGLIGGGTVGYNWQHGSLVLGIEGDVSGSGIDDAPLVIVPSCVVQGCRANLNWLATGRARIGYAGGALMPYVSSWMPYITGGVAAGGLEGAVDTGVCGGPPTCGYNEARWGWTAGGGVEWKFPGHWSAKVEYLYVNLQTPTFSTPSVKASNFTANIVRVGLNLPLP